MLQTSTYKEAVVAEIVRQVSDWNINTRQNGIVTSSQGGFNISITGGRQIRAPDVAFTTRETYRQLSTQQLTTIQGQAFSPVFVVEVEDLTEDTRLTSLTSKFKEEYFSAGVRFGLLVDPINKTIYTFRRNSQDVVRHLDCGWRNISGGVFLPGFDLDVNLIEDAVSQQPSDESSDDDGDMDVGCPKCNHCTHKEDA
ncbi:hypothetical protein BGX21_000528 [Mortierella sp. AD011]|nr:hypothetical protein BGX20_010200 [Mortierella sp. AD010]KAF9387557.1 hypothetical protein BGX21_000528 [Mortierella sp. AD011]